MNYYWSCWFDKEELRSKGAIGVIPAHYMFQTMRSDHVYAQIHVDGQKHWAFQADESFPLFLKLSSDKSVVEISKRYYNGLQRGDHIKLGGGKISKAIWECQLDF